MSTPLVSICCITYNHAPFIRQCLDGFLMQQPPTCIISSLSKANQSIIQADWFEILIHDDCSTDGTTEIIREYTEKYPNLIKPLYETENQFCKPGRESMDFYNYRRAQGKYIAICEGDDYWTDPLKLQKQVNWMEAHPEYSICFHNFKRYLVDKKQFIDVTYQKLQPMVDGGVDITPYMFFHHSYGGQPLTMLFRVSMFDYAWSKMYKGYRDTHEIYHLLRAGKGRYLDFVGGVYNQHSGGISTSATTMQSCREEREHILELYLHNRDDQMLADYLKDILLWNYDSYNRCGDVKTFWNVWLFYLKKVPLIALTVLIVIIKRKIKKDAKTMLP